MNTFEQSINVGEEVSPRELVDLAKQQALEVLLAAAATVNGEKLKSMPRYWRFKPEDCSPDEWVKLIGPNGIIFNHLQETLETAAWFIQRELELCPGLFTLQEVEIILVAACSHDFGEGVTSDIPEGIKTDADTLSEKTAFLENINDFVVGLSGKAMVSYMIAGYGVIFAEADEKMKRALNVIERIGYMNDAIGAVKRERSLTSGELKPHMKEKLGICDAADPQIKAVSLRRMYVEIFGSKTISKLIDLARFHPMARIYLLSHQKTVTEAMDSVTDADFAWYGTEANVDPSFDERDRRATQFFQERELWREWLLDEAA